MFTLARGRAGSLWKTLAWAVGIWVCTGSSAVVYGGGHHKDDGGLWGEYGYGPHFRNNSCHDRDFGYPYFTHGMGCGVPYQGYTGSPGVGYGAFGPYTGAPAYPDVVPAYKMSTTAAPASGELYSSAYVAPDRANGTIRPMAPARR